MEKDGLEKAVLSYTLGMETTETKNSKTPTKENGVFLSANDAMEYRAYKKQKKIGEISFAMSRSATPIGIGDDAQRVCERAVRIRQAAVKAPLTRLLSVKDYLRRNKMKMDCVVGGNGEQLLKVKAYEIKLARKYGASEITVAVNPAFMSACKYPEIRKELKKLRRAAKHMTLKVWVDKKYSFPSIARVARICCELGIEYVCVPHFIGCERLRYDLSRGCLLEISDVYSLADYQRLIGAGVGRIVTTRPWEIYNEWLKDAEKIELGAVPLGGETEKTQQASVQASKETTEKPKEQSKTPVLPSVPAISSVKAKAETDYRCRLEGTELQFL